MLMLKRVLLFISLAAASAAAFYTRPTAANMVVSEVIIDFSSPLKRRADIEVTNRGRERMYVLVEPSRILNPGKPDERRVKIVDPAEHDLLVSPLRMVLEPGQIRIVRFVALSAPKSRDRIYRVTVRPVVGKLKAKQYGLKVVVGFDLLVIQRPAGARANVKAWRKDGWLVITNIGTTNALLMNGKQCRRGTSGCVRLPTRRVYSGAKVRIRLPGNGPVHYLMKVGSQTERRTF